MSQVQFTLVLSRFTFEFKNHTVDLDVNFSLKECTIYINFRDISDREKNFFLVQEISDFVFSKFNYSQTVYPNIYSLER